VLIKKEVIHLFCEYFSIFDCVSQGNNSTYSVSETYYELILPYYMKNIEKTFQIISYLQYPFLLIALFYSFKPIYDRIAFGNMDTYLSCMNNALMFIGIGVSFSALQDSTKTQNNFSKRIWQDKKKGVIALYIITLMAVLSFIGGGVGYYFAVSSVLEEIAVGLLVLGIGLLGLLSVAINMYKYQQSIIK